MVRTAPRGAIQFDRTFDHLKQLIQLMNMKGTFVEEIGDEEAQNSEMRRAQSHIFVCHF